MYLSLIPLTLLKFELLLKFLQYKIEINDYLKKKTESLVDYKIYKDEKLVGIVFENKSFNDFPDKFQVTGDGKRTFYSTLKECKKHFE